MACAWHTALDFTPAKLAVCVDKQSFTRALLQASGEFAMGVPCPAQADLLATVGAVSGRDVAGQEKPHPWAPLPPLRRHADMRPRSSAE